MIYVKDLSETRQSTNDCQVGQQTEEMHLLSQKDVPSIPLVQHLAINAVCSSFSRIRGTTTSTTVVLCCFHRVSHRLPWGTLSHGSKTGTNWVSEKMTVLDTKSFFFQKRMFGCSAATSVQSVPWPLSTPNTPFFFQQRKVVFVDHSFRVGKECNVCVDCPEFPVRHPFQTKAVGYIPEIGIQFQEKRNSAFI